MPAWEVILIAWVFLWALQSVGVWFQVRGYSRLTGGLQREFSKGYIGSGHDPRRLARGSIAVIVTDPELVTQRVMIMTGMTFLARFKRFPELEGVALDRLLAIAEEKRYSASMKKSLGKAIEQIERVRAARLKETSKDSTELRPQILGA